MKKFVLLSVEDNDAFAQAIEIALEEAALGVVLTRVPDGEQALNYLRLRPPYEEVPRPELVLLDLNLPRKSGFEILAEMGSDPALREIPVVVLSSSNHANDRARSLALGAKDYILKPTDFEQLMSALVKTCNRYIQ